MNHCRKRSVPVLIFLSAILIVIAALSEAEALRKLSQSEKTFVSRARDDLKKALYDPDLSEDERMKLVGRSAATYKEYGQAPDFPHGAIALKKIARSDYEQARRNLSWTNSLYQVFSKRLLDQQIKIINTMQIEVLEEQIKLTLPGNTVVELSKDVLGTVLNMNLVEGMGSGKYGDARRLAARFMALAKTKRLVENLRRLHEEQRRTAKRRYRELQELSRLQQKLRRRYQTAYDAAFTFKGYETPASQRRLTPVEARQSKPPAKKTAAANKCTCEDWDRDGRYGVVLGGKAIAPNVGSLGACQGRARAIPACQVKRKTAQAKTAVNKCTCEDWDRDGRYGVVFDGKAIAPNVGSYSKCLRHTQTLNRCLRPRQ
jgi:hypothetical protein